MSVECAHIVCSERMSMKLVHSYLHLIQNPSYNLERQVPYVMFKECSPDLRKLEEAVSSPEQFLVRLLLVASGEYHQRNIIAIPGRLFSATKTFT